MSEQVPLNKQESDTPNPPKPSKKLSQENSEKSINSSNTEQSNIASTSQPQSEKDKRKPTQLESDIERASALASLLLQKTNQLESQQPSSLIASPCGQNKEIGSDSVHPVQSGSLIDNKQLLDTKESTQIINTGVFDSNSQDMAEGIKIEPLTSSNYPAWLVQIRAILELKNLWIDPGSAAATCQLDSNKKIRRLAYNQIVCRCDQSHATYLNGIAEYDSIKALAKLSDKFNGTGLMRNMEIFSKAIAMRINENNLEQQIDEMRNLYAKFASQGVTIPKFIAVTNLMGALPPHYGGVISNFNNCTEDTINFEDVASAVLSEHRRQLMRTSSSENALATQFVRKSNNNRSFRCNSCNRRGHISANCTNKSTITCSNCQIKGHTVENCRKKNREGASSSQQKANRAQVIDNNPVQVAFSANLIQRQSRAAKRFRPYTNPIRSIEFSPKVKSLIVSVDSSSINLNTNTQAISTNVSSANEYEDSRFLDLSKPLTPHVISNDWNEDDADDVITLEEKINLLRTPVSDTSIVEPLTPRIIKLQMQDKCYNSSLKSPNVDDWLMDSGASVHMCHNKTLFDFLNPNDQGQIRIANGRVIPIIAYGDISLAIQTDSEILKLQLKHTAFVPDLHVNLISVKCLTNENYSVRFIQAKCFLDINKDSYLVAKFVDNNYIVNVVNIEQALTCLHEWHRKLAHRNLQDIKRQSKFGLKITKCNCTNDCDACIRGKSTALPFMPSQKPAKRLDLLTSDLCGKITPASLNNHLYFITIIDAYSDFTFVEFLRSKDEAKLTIKRFISHINTQFNEYPRTFRSDGGGEYVNEDLTNFFNDKGIKFEKTIHYTPQQNGISERKNRTLNDAARTMLISSKLPSFLWNEAIANAVYTQNRIVHDGQTKSPLELFFEKNIPVKFMEFGAPVYSNTLTQNRGKFSPRAIVMRALNFDNQSKGVRLWNGNSITIERNVRFKNIEEINQLENLSDNEIIDTFNENSSEENVEVSSPPEEQCFPRRSKRILDQMSNHAKEIEIPKTFKQAMASEHSNDWMIAIEAELQAHAENGTFEITNLPDGKKAVGNRWVFTCKNENGNIIFKARLVAQGFNQVPGIDFEEIFAPVARSATIRLLLSMAGKHRWHVNQLDVKTAFLNGEITEEVYMLMPQGLDHHDSEKVLRLRKSIYGLKQAARNWNQLLDETMINIGYVAAEDDPCLYSLKNDSGISFFAVHVDDILITTSTTEMFETLFEKLSKSFTLKNLGEPTKYLGVEIYKENGLYSINQASYIAKLAKSFNLDMSKSHQYPIHPGYNKFSETDFINDNTEFRTIIGSLLYISTNTRPDISLGVTLLSQRINKPRLCDVQEGKRIIRYLNNTINYKLKLNNELSDQSIISFSDANHCECLLTGKSISGSVIFINGGAISWKCRKQSLVALSITESEFYALAETTKELIWLSSLLQSFENISQPLKIYIDNQSTIKMVTNNEVRPRTKYIGVRFHFIRDLSHKGNIKFEFCPTQFNVADMFTKPLPFPRIKLLRGHCGISATTELDKSSTSPMLLIQSDN